MKHIERFHYLTQDMREYTHSELAELACLGGAKWVQLRVKGQSFDEWKLTALETRKICGRYDATLIINDNVEIAHEVKADGVHLGLKDIPVKEARKILGDNYIIGGTANTAEDIEHHLSQGADYIGIGPYRHTDTKENLSAVLGPEGIYRLTKQFTGIPIIAIGGIQPHDVYFLNETDLHGIAVSSAVNRAESPTEAVKEFLEALK